MVYFPVSFEVSALTVQSPSYSYPHFFSQAFGVFLAISYLVLYSEVVTSFSIQDGLCVVLVLMEEVGGDNIVFFFGVEDYAAFYQDGMVTELCERLET